MKAPDRLYRRDMELEEADALRQKALDREHAKLLKLWIPIVSGWDWGYVKDKIRTSPGKQYRVGAIADLVGEAAFKEALAAAARKEGLQIVIGRPHGGTGGGDDPFDEENRAAYAVPAPAE